MSDRFLATVRRRGSLLHCKLRSLGLGRWSIQPVWQKRAPAKACRRNLCTYQYTPTDTVQVPVMFCVETLFNHTRPRFSLSHHYYYHLHSSRPAASAARTRAALNYIPLYHGLGRFRSGAGGQGGLALARSEPEKGAALALRK